MGYDVAEAMAAGVWLLGNGPYLAGIILWYVPRNCLMRLKDMVLKPDHFADVPEALTKCT